MDNIELLKQELVNQKNALVNKGITVNSVHTNPSPSEITNAINSINMPDFSLVTAEETSVASGKTFYNSNGQLVTGNMDTGSTLEQAEFLQNYMNEIISPVLPSFLTTLREYAFYSCSALEGHLVLPEGLTKIPPYCFGGTSITGITIPSSCTYMGTYCFSNCPNLTEVHIPDSVTVMEAQCFPTTKNITTFTLGSGLTTLAKATIYNFSYLTTLTIPINITTIEAQNIRSCTALTDLYIEGASVVAQNADIFRSSNSSMRVWVPFAGLAYYPTATNWSQYPSYYISEVEITTETTFPTLGTTTLKWFGNLTDATNRTNAITVPNGAGTYYARV